MRHSVLPWLAILFLTAAGCGGGGAGSGTGQTPAVTVMEPAVVAGSVRAHPLSLGLTKATVQPVRFTVTTDWGSGFGADVALTNQGASLSAWTLEFDFAHDITAIWNARIVAHD